MPANDTICNLSKEQFANKTHDNKIWFTILKFVFSYSKKYFTHCQTIFIILAHVCSISH